MRFRNATLFVALSIAWGSAFTAIKAGLEFFPPVLFAAVRYDLAGILMMAYVLLTTDHWLPENRDEWLVVGIDGLLLIAAYHAFLFIGEQGTTSGASAIVVSLSPILTTVFARAFLPHERLTTVGTVGLLLGFVGVGILSDPDPGNLLGTRTVSLGFVFVAAVAFALGSVLTQRLDTDMPARTMEGWSMVIGAGLLHAASVGIGESVADVELTPEAIGALVFLSVVSSAIGFLIYFDLLNRLGSIEINLVSYAAPVVATVTGFIFLSETPTALTVVGFGFVFGGFVLLKRRTIRNQIVRSRSYAD